DAVISMNLAEQTRKVLATLTPREEKVLRMRFGIGEKSDHTLEEVGQDFEVTRERIRQIEAKALRKLRHPSRSKRLKSFMESEGGGAYRPVNMRKLSVKIEGKERIVEIDEGRVVVDGVVVEVDVVEAEPGLWLLRQGAMQTAARVDGSGKVTVAIR